MIERPERQIAEFAARRRRPDHDPRRGDAAHRLRALADPRRGRSPPGSRCAPRRRLTVYAEVAEKVDLALCMTVNPGWGGQQLHRGLDRPARGALGAAAGRGRRDRGRRRHRARHRRALPRGGGDACSSPARPCSARADPAAAYAALAERGRRPAPVERRQREREQPRGAGVADLGAQHLVGDRAEQHPADEQRPPRRARAPRRAPPARARARPG